MNFKDYWNSLDLDKYRTTEDYCWATWEACKKETNIELQEMSDNAWKDCKKRVLLILELNAINIKNYSKIVKEIKEL